MPSGQSENKIVAAAEVHAQIPIAKELEVQESAPAGLTNEEFFARIDALSLKSGSDSVRMIREDRDSR